MMSDVMVNDQTRVTIGIQVEPGVVGRHSAEVVS